MACQFGKCEPAQRCEVYRPEPTHLAVVLAAVKDASRLLRGGPPKAGHPLTAAARAGARNERPGRENGSAGAEQENWRRKRWLTKWKECKSPLDNECPIQGFPTPGTTSAPRTQVAGVGKAPRHEVAGSGAPVGQRALWGIDFNASHDDRRDSGRRRPGVCARLSARVQWACR